MQQFRFSPGATSQTIDVFLPDSSSTIGAGLAALVFNTANLKAYYRNTATGTVTVITLATQTVGGAWSSGGFVELDATNAKGMYRFDIPNAVLAAAGEGFIHFYGATNLAQTPVQISVGYVPANVVQLGGVTQSATDLKDFADDGYDPSTNKVQGVVLTDTTTTLTNLPAITANWLTAAGTAADFSTEIRTAINGGDYALSTDANGRIRIVDGTGAGELDTSSGVVIARDHSGAALATAASIAALNNLSSAQAQTAAEAAIVTHRLDELLNADSDIDGAAPPTVGSVFHELMTKTAGSFTYDQTTDSLEAINDSVLKPTVAGRTFDVSAGGEGGIDWNNVGSPTSLQSFPNTGWGSVTLVVSLDTNAISAASIANDAITAAKIATGAIDADALATDGVQEIRNAITGGAYALDTDANGRIRIVDGTAAGELDTASGLVKISGTLQTLDSLNNLSATQVWDLADGIETGITPRKSMRALSAVIAGIIADANTATETFKGIGQASGGTTRITVSVDSSGNRSAVTLNL